MTLLEVRKLLFAAPLLAVGAWGMTSTNIEAAPTTTVTTVVTDDFALAGSNCTYYSDASLTVVVGKFGKDCCNNTVAWGHKTAFKVCGGCFICFPPPQ